MKLQKGIICGLMICFALVSYGQDDDRWSLDNKHFISTQAFIVLTPLLDPSPEYFQLNYGYRLSSKDELSIEALTWVYQGPGGRQYGPDYEQEESNFPGDVKAIGGGLAYKRMLWKGVFGQLHTTAFHQTYRDADKKKIQSGFQLFNTLRFGYHFKIFKKRWFLAPSVAFTYWPINTNLPESFQIEEDKWDNFFLFEPGLQIGITF